MTGGRLQDYVDGFRRVAQALGGEQAERLEAPGLVGVSHVVDGRPRGRLLVVDDRAHGLLAARLPDLGVGLVTVLGDAPRCRALFDESVTFERAEAGAAMVRSDLEDLPLSPLPAGLEVHPVQRTPDEPPGVPFDRAVAAARAYDPESGAVPEAVMRAFLLALPRARLLCALDDSGEVRATSASGVVADGALVVMVSTDPAWRGRGVGTTMTALALDAARAQGAVRACLEASPLGEPIYRRLGFETVGAVQRFAYAG